MAYTLRDVQEWALSLEMAAKYYEERPGRDWLKVGNFALAQLLPEIPWIFAGDLAVTKTWSLAADTHTYSFTTTDSFRGIIDALLVFWDSGLTDAREARMIGNSAEDLAIREDYIEADDPAYVLHGQSLYLYPAPSSTQGELWARHKKKATAFSGMTDAIQVADECAIAMAYQMGGMVVSEPKAMTALFGMAGGEIARLKRQSRGQGIVVTR